MDAKSLIKMYNREKTSTERSNFNDIYETCAEFCNPKADDIQSKKTAGERTDSQRVTDIGIKARRMFTAGMMSHLFPQGQNWIRVVTVDRELMSNDNVIRALSSVSKKFINAIENSNFYEEMGQCIDHCGYIGTTTLYCESDKKNFINWRSHYINQFYFCENYQGQVDTVIREFKLTARQALQQFGENCPERIRQEAENMSTQTKEHEFIHVVMPRSGYTPNTDKKEDKKVASIYVSLTTKEIIMESGFDEMPYSVGRFYKTNYEKYGRSPASEVINTLPMINRMEVARIRGAERVSNPPWLAPNDGSVRRISNDQGSIIYYNAGNPLSKPEQLRPMDNIVVNDQMIQKKEQEVMDAFYIPLFNPLHNKQNMTAFESQERLNLSLQFLTPAVNRLNKYFVKPALERAFGIMLRAGAFRELEIEELSEASLDFDLVGKASIASRQIELFGTMTAIQQMAQIAQLKPEIFDNLNPDKTARFIQEVNMMPIDLQLSEDEVQEIRDGRAEAAAAQQQAMQAQTLSDAYAKTRKAPEEGSGAEFVQELVNQEVETAEEG
tara:strand:- start:1475 stop:3136 length:1662 start_codon:yes stop_codon:yes gene_type:complete